MPEPHTFTIRKAVETDADTIIRFNTSMAMETENKVLDPDKIGPGVHGLLEKPQYGFYMMAEHNGSVIGSLMITYEWSDWRNGLFWWIQSVYVVPEFRRKGVYRSMYEAIKEMASSEPDVCGFRLYVEKENTIALRTYHDLGMNETHYRMYEEIM